VAKERQAIARQLKQIEARYGFVPDPSASVFENAVNLRANSTSPNCNLPIPTNMAFHDLTEDHSAPHEAKFLMGLGDKFIPVPESTKEENFFTGRTRFEREFLIKVIFAPGPELELPALSTTDEVEKETKLYVNSNWTPGYGDVPCWVSRRVSRFLSKLSRRFRKRKGTPNLLPFQQQIMKDLLNHPTLLFPTTDKGLGPCAVSHEQYVIDGLLHLENPEIYERMSTGEAMRAVSDLQDQIEHWLDEYKHVVPKMAQAYIRKHMSECSKSPFGQFYLLYKIHKGMKNGRWPTRPVCSDVSSISHGLGKWVTEQLQPIARAQKSYFKDTFALKDLLDKLRLTPNERFWKADATAMYTNIKTPPALSEISAYLRRAEGVSFHHYRSQTLIDALNIVFKHNFLKFGDTYWRQKSGTGMGISPAPPWTTIFFGLYEERRRIL